MSVGPFYVDWYNVHQYVAFGLALLCLVGAGLFALTAAVRAAIHRRLLAAVTLTAGALFVPTATAMTPLAGQWLEGVWNWVLYHPQLLGSYLGYGSYGYGYGYGYGVTYYPPFPLMPDFYVLTYGFAVSHSLAMGGVAVALVASTVGIHLLLPFGLAGRDPETRDLEGLPE